MIFYYPLIITIIIKFIFVNMLSKRKLKRNYCEICDKRASYNYIDIKYGIRCKAHILEDMVDVLNKKCKENGCVSRPHFNFEGCKCGLYCKLHAKRDMINVYGRKCAYFGCKTTPNFNYDGETKGIFCSEHAEPDMIDVKNKKCIEPGCKKYPIYNYPSEKRGIYCKQHAADNMVDVKNKKCIEPGCTKQPTFNYRGEKGGMYCKNHAMEDMVDVKHSKCIEYNCQKRPTFNYLNKKTAIYCRNHAIENMVNVVDKKCIYEDCMKRASYNLFGHPANYCGKHKPHGSILNPTPKCSFKQCNKLATHGNNKVTNHCENHANEDEYDMFSKPCILCGLENILDENHHCYFCNPSNMLKYLHAKELRVKKYFDDHMISYDQHDTIVNNGKYGKERPDFVFIRESHIVIVEVDENQHIDRLCYCEQIRMVNISQSFQLPTVFIRYNPDKYKNSNEKIKNEHESHAIRMNILTSVINKYINTPPVDFFVCNILIL